MGMYEKDKSHRITLRLNDEQFDFVTVTASMMGVSPSDFLRMMINTGLSSVDENTRYRMGIVKKNLMERGVGRENDEADSDNKLPEA